MGENAVVSPHDELKTFIAEQIGITKNRIDEMDGKVKEALDTLQRVKSPPAEVVDQLSKLDDRLQLIERAGDTAARTEAGGRIPAQGGGGNAGVMRRALDSSEYIKRLQEAKGRARLPARGLGDRLVLPSSLMRAKPLRRTELLIDTNNFAQVPTYRQQMVEWALENSSLIDRIPTVPCRSETYYWEQEDLISGESGIAKIVNGAVGAGTSTDLTLVDINGIMVGSRAVVRRTDGAGTFLGYERLTVSALPGGMVVRFGAVNIVGAVGDRDTIVFESFTGTAEAGTKPYSIIKTAHVSKEMVTFAVMFDLTRQALLFNPGLEAKLQTKGARAVRRSLNWHLLYGTGTAPQISGLLADTSRQTYTWSTGGTMKSGTTISAVTGDTMADAIMKACAMVPDEGMVEVTLRKENWLDICGEKAADGHYVYGAMAPIAVINRPNLKSIGEYPVNTEFMLKANGDFLVADHVASSELAVADTGEFAFGYMDDDFGTNQIKARYEQVLLHAILSYQAYVHGNFDSRP